MGEHPERLGKSKFMKHTKLNTEFDKLEKQRKNLFEKLKKYDNKVLNQKPSESQWSVMEVINHLIVAEDFSSKYLQKKTQDTASAAKVGLKETFRSFLLNTYLGSSKKFKSPTVALPPGTYTTLSDAHSSWDRVRGDIQSIWTKLPEDLLDRNWFKHPVAGKLSLGQMLSFMEAHVHRHEKQIWRTLKEVSH